MLDSTSIRVIPVCFFSLVEGVHGSDNDTNTPTRDVTNVAQYSNPTNQGTFQCSAYATVPRRSRRRSEPSATDFFRAMSLLRLEKRRQRRQRHVGRAGREWLDDPGLPDEALQRSPIPTKAIASMFCRLMSERSPLTKVVAFSLDSLLGSCLKRASKMCRAAATHRQGLFCQSSHLFNFTSSRFESLFHGPSVKWKKPLAKCRNLGAIVFFPRKISFY